MDDTTDPSEDARRIGLRKRAVGTLGAGVLGASVGSASAQTEGNDEGTPTDGGVVEQDSGGQKALMFTESFKPDAKFVFVSDVIDWIPSVEEVTDNVWSDYNTRVIRYLNTGEHVLVYVAHAAEVGPYDEERGFVVNEDREQGPVQPRVYDMDRNYTLWGDSPNLLTINFLEINEETEDDVLANEEWWRHDGASSTPSDTPTEGS